MGIRGAEGGVVVVVVVVVVVGCRCAATARGEGRGLGWVPLIAAQEQSGVRCRATALDAWPGATATPVTDSWVYNCTHGNQLEILMNVLISCMIQVSITILRRHLFNICSTPFQRPFNVRSTCPTERSMLGAKQRNSRLQTTHNVGSK